MANWLEEHEKQSELLGGAGDVLANSQSDPYLSQAVLDLQFGHSQRVGYDVATNVLNQLQGIGALHKRRPEHASWVFCVRRIFHRSSWKRALSATTVKSACWEATVTSSRLPKRFITVCVNILKPIRFSQRRKAVQARRPVPRCRVR